VNFHDSAPSRDEEQVAALQAHILQTLSRYPPAEQAAWLIAFHRQAKRRASRLMLRALEPLLWEFRIPLEASPGRGDASASAG
jgi:hypothetical protein